MATVRFASDLTSLQCHVNKVYDREAPCIKIDNPVHALPTVAIRQGDGPAACRCGAVATHFANHFGCESLYCQEHAARAMERYGHIDPLTWFCRPLKFNKDPEASFWIKVMDVRNKPAFMISWTWCAERDSTYRLFREKPSLQPDVSIHPVTTEEGQQLIGQMLDETVLRQRRLFALGFADEHPFERPDCSQGYSWCKNMCTECPDDHFEPYYFRYPATAAHLEEAAKMLREQSDVVFDANANKFLV